MQQYMSEIRELVNKPRNHYRFSRSTGMFNQLCSSMDVVEDTILAIEAFENSAYGKDISALYLATYGLFQVLFVQQDAVFHLAEALGTSKTEEQYLNTYPRLKEVRTLRNITTGHPTKKREGKNAKSYHFISQITLNETGFSLLSYSDNGQQSYREIMFSDVIAKQKEGIAAILEEIRNMLELEEIAHKEKFKMEKLSLFFQKIAYPLEKLNQGTHERGNKSDLAMGLFGLASIEDLLKNFKKAAELRVGSLKVFGLEELYRELEYPLDELRQFFSSSKDGQEPSIDIRTAQIFAYFIRNKIYELRDAAKEIDEDYET